MGWRLERVGGLSASIDGPDNRRNWCCERSGAGIERACRCPGDLMLYSHYQKNSYNWNYGVPVLGSALPNPKAEFRIRVLWESLDTQGISPSRLGLDITLNTSSPTVLNSGRIFFM